MWTRKNYPGTLSNQPHSINNYFNICPSSVRATTNSLKIQHMLLRSTGFKDIKYHILSSEPANFLLVNQTRDSLSCSYQISSFLQGSESWLDLRCFRGDKVGAALTQYCRPDSQTNLIDTQCNSDESSPIKFWAYWKSNSTIVLDQTSNIREVCERSHQIPFWSNSVVEVRKWNVHCISTSNFVSRVNNFLSPLREFGANRESSSQHCCCSICTLGKIDFIICWLWVEM